MCAPCREYGDAPHDEHMKALGMLSQRERDGNEQEGNAGRAQQHVIFAGGTQDGSCDEGSDSYARQDHHCS